MDPKPLDPICPWCKQKVAQLGIKKPPLGLRLALAFCSNCGAVFGPFDSVLLRVDPANLEPQ
jgi:hypothetical protein